MKQKYNLITIETKNPSVLRQGSLVCVGGDVYIVARHTVEDLFVLINLIDGNRYFDIPQTLSALEPILRKECFTPLPEGTEIKIVAA